MKSILVKYYNGYRVVRTFKFKSDQSWLRTLPARCSLADTVAAFLIASVPNNAYSSYCSWLRYNKTVRAINQNMDAHWHELNPDWRRSIRRLNLGRVYIVYTALQLPLFTWCQALYLSNEAAVNMTHPRRHSSDTCLMPLSGNCTSLVTLLLLVSSPLLLNWSLLQSSICLLLWTELLEIASVSVLKICLCMHVPANEM